MTQADAKFVISHGPAPRFPVTDDVHLVWLSSLPPPDDIRMRVIMGYDYFSEPESIHRSLSGSFGSQVIHKYLLEQSAKPDRVTIAQYRKFVSRDKFGHHSGYFKRVRASTYPGMQLVDGLGASKMAQFPSAKTSDFIIGQTRQFASNLEQYSKHHKLDDLLLFVVAAIRSGTLSSSEALEFLRCRRFLPGGLELGTYKYEFWSQNFGSMMRTSSYFIDHFTVGDPVDENHSRALSFCLERLGSFLMLKYVDAMKASGAAVSDYFGYIHTVFDEQLPRRGRASRHWYEFRALLGLVN